MSHRRLPFACAMLALVVGACAGAGSGATPSVGATPTAGTATPRTPTAKPSAPPALTAAPATPSPRAATPAPTSIYDPAADPSTDIAAALAAAATDGKPVLLDFGADWCPDCVAIARMFETPAFADYLSSVHVVRIDVGKWDRHLDVAKQYGNPIATGIPAVVLLSPEGTVLGSTADGRLASAASMAPNDVLRVLLSLGG